MVQFRKSKKFGPVRITASKNGIGVSAGAGPVRVSRGADGKVRRTIRAGGVYDTKVVGGGAPPTATPSSGETPVVAHAPTFRYGPVSVAPIEAKGHNGTVMFDGTAVTLTRGGISAKLGGLHTVTFPITAVCGVDWKEPTMLVNGHLRFLIPDGGGALPDEVLVPQDNHAVLVTKQQRKRFDDLLDALDAGAQNPSQQ